MKKPISIVILVLILLVNVFTGCSNKTANKAANNELDIKNKDALYDFVKKEIVDLSKETFDTWEVYHFDVTGDGTDEAILVSTYGQQWYEKMEIVSIDSGEYKRIPSDIPLGKDSNLPSFTDGFLKVEVRYGGTGEQFEVMNLYVYNGSEVVQVLNELTIKHEVAFPNASYTETGEIEGKLTDFVYTLTKIDNKTDKQSIVNKVKYTYNADKKVFDEQPVTAKAAQDDVSKGISGFKAETIRGTNIDYSKHSAVIVPFYPEDGLNYKALGKVPFIDNPDGGALEFAVIGKMDDMKVKRIDNGTVSEEWTYGELENSILVIHSNLQTDMSHYSITGKVDVGGGSYESVTFTLDDMRDPADYEIILIQ